MYVPGTTKLHLNFQLQSSPLSGCTRTSGSGVLNLGGSLQNDFRGANEVRGNTRLRQTLTLTLARVTYHEEVEGRYRLCRNDRENAMLLWAADPSSPEMPARKRNTSHIVLSAGATQPHIVSETSRFKRHNKTQQATSISRNKRIPRVDMVCRVDVQINVAYSSEQSTHDNGCDISVSVWLAKINGRGGESLVVGVVTCPRSTVQILPRNK